MNQVKIKKNLEMNIMKQHYMYTLRSLILFILSFFILKNSYSLDIYKKDMTEVSDGIYSFGSFSARSFIVISNTGIIITDPVDPINAQEMLKAIRKISDLPFRYVVYSHQHWDHVLGGKVFKDLGAEIISHSKCLKHFQQHKHDDLILPDRTIDENTSLTIGNKTLNLMYFGKNHGDCTLVMQVDGDDVLYVNDLVTPYSVGLGFMPDYDPIEWIRTLKELEERDNWSRMMGAHGIPIAPKEALVQRRRLLESLMKEVKKEMDAGYRREELYARIQLEEEFQNMRGYDLHIKRAAERIFHFYTMGW